MGVTVSRREAEWENRYALSWNLNRLLSSEQMGQVASRSSHGDFIRGGLLEVSG